LIDPLALGWILAAHWLSDFLFQPHSIASTKGKSWKALALHIVQYVVCMALLTLPLGLGWAFVAWTGALHLATDAWTARLSGWCYRTERIKPFWVVIGFDQLLHGLALVWALSVCGGAS